MMRVARRQLVSRSIMPVSIVLVCAIVAIVAFTLWQAREDARARAQREGENIVQAIEADIARNIELYDLSLQGLREALATKAVADVAQEVQRLALFDHAANANYMGAMLALNATGDIIVNSRSQRHARSTSPIATTFRSTYKDQISDFISAAPSQAVWSIRAEHRAEPEAAG